MTKARQVLVGSTYLITRRVVMRHHLLRPDRQINQLFLYSLGLFATRFGIEVHLPVLMSTHEHIVLTDTHGNLPVFLEHFHRTLARGTKAIRHDWEGAVWDDQPTSRVALLSPQAVVEKLAYCLANPTAAGLVRYARDWPGVTLRASELGRKRWRIRRPDFYFSPKNSVWPEYVEFEATVPATLLELYSADEVRSMVAQQCTQLEHDAWLEAKRNGWSFLGPDRCTKVSPYRRARGFVPVRDRNPTFAVGRGQDKLFRLAVRQLRAFQEHYRFALEQWRAGSRDVCFPHGTWWMQRFHAVQVADPPAAAA